MRSGNPRFTAGFSLVEILVALAIVAAVLTLAVPKYFSAVDKAREAVLKENLYVMRDSIEKFYSDQGKYPDSLAELVQRKYLRAVPVDPLTESANSWIVSPPDDGTPGLVRDVRSAAPNRARDGSWYREW